MGRLDGSRQVRTLPPCRAPWHRYHCLREKIIMIIIIVIIIIIIVIPLPYLFLPNLYGPRETDAHGRADLSFLSVAALGPLARCSPHWYVSATRPSVATTSCSR